MAPSTRKERAAAALLVAGGTLTGLLAAELLLRCFPAAGARLESFRIGEDRAPYMRIMSRPKRRGFYRPSDLLGYEHEPDVPGRTNRYGMMGKTHPLEKGPGVSRVLLLGDSVAEPPWVGESLEAELNSWPQSAGSRRRFEVWNAGTGSYDVRRYSLYLRHRGLGFRPDLLVNFITMNDFGLDTNTYYLDKNGFMGYHFPLEALRRRGFVPHSGLLRRSAVYRFALMRAEAWLEARGAGPEEAQREAGRRYVGEILRTAGEHSLPVLFVVFPYLDAPESLSPRRREEYRTITEVLAEAGARWLDLSALFAEMRRRKYPMRLQPEDSVHPSQAAYQDISREIARSLRGQKLLEGRQ
ncbi:MAG: SGNH/GDSL hydrolase family protein [Elusimicrobia bacterium]|nr:SGNH/GDSL hydrolase family protein [Elusimicrobiota bacterium]